MLPRPLSSIFISLTGWAAPSTSPTRPVRKRRTTAMTHGESMTLPLDPLGTKEKYKFTAEELDPNSALTFLRARYYDSNISRFLSRDSKPGLLTSPLTINEYQYTQSNPLRLTDHSGMSAIDASMGASATSTPPSILIIPQPSSASQTSDSETVCVYAQPPPGFDITSDVAGLFSVVAGLLSGDFSPFMLDPYGPINSNGMRLGCTKLVRA